MRDQILALLERRSRWPELIAVIISAVWLALCLIYLDIYVGWEALGAFLPHELGAFLAGVFAPLAFLWLGVAYTGRSNELHSLSAQLQHE